MGKIAFVFSGQGDQFPGMGKALYDAYPEAAAVFEMCEALRPGTMAQCFSGTAEELQETENTQPCLFAMEFAAAAVLTHAGISPDAAAGFSLGEVTAAAAAGLFTPETGFRLVCRRGELMQKAARMQDTAMAAVVKLEEKTVEEICRRFDGMYPVNYNCPGQITVSGLACRMPEFSRAVKAAGGRAIPLKVKGGFHSPFMAEAAADFGKVLADVRLRETAIPLYSNVTAQPYAENGAELLARQISSPVRWETTIRNMIAAGIDVFVEIGPGNTLSNMIRKINGSVKLCCCAQWDTLEKELSLC